MEVLGVIVLCCILFFGGQLILGHKFAYSLKGLLPDIAHLYPIINPAKSLSNGIYNRSVERLPLNSFEEILHADIALKNRQSPLRSKNKKNIEFKDVNFAYEDVEVLHHINLNIEKGKTIALVGSSGAGKSTLADLIPRFHDAVEAEYFGCC